jgi:hypothetical protein
VLIIKELYHPKGAIPEKNTLNNAFLGLDFAQQMSGQNCPDERTTSDNSAQVESAAAQVGTRAARRSRQNHDEPAFRVGPMGVTHRRGTFVANSKLMSETFALIIDFHTRFDSKVIPFAGSA